jgi:hypothetical protein
MWLITLRSHKDKTLIHCLKFWIPKPPSAFGVQMSFQALKQSPFEFVSSLISFHTKNTMIVVSLAMNFLVKYLTCRDRRKIDLMSS